MSLKSLLAKIGIGKEDGISSGLFIGRTDFHSHILPGVDDGVKTIGESIAILDRYEAMGIERVWLTPHIMEDVPNKTADLRRRFDELRDAYSGNVELKLAAENMIDNLLSSDLRLTIFCHWAKKGICCLSRHLTSIPLKGSTKSLNALSKRLPAAAGPSGEIPLHGASSLCHLKGTGILLQLNLLSLTLAFTANRRAISLTFSLKRLLRFPWIRYPQARSSR